MKKEDVFPSRFWKAADLNGKPMVVTIEGTVRETLKTPDGKSDEKPVLYFTGSKKSLSLNVTNWDHVAGNLRRGTPTRGLVTSSNCIRPKRGWAARRWTAFVSDRRRHADRNRKKPPAPKPPKKGGKAAKSSLRDDMADEIPFLGAAK